MYPGLRSNFPSAMLIVAKNIVILCAGGKCACRMVNGSREGGGTVKGTRERKDKLVTRTKRTVKECG